MPRRSDFATTPVNELFGFQIHPGDRERTVVTFRPDRVHTQEYGVVHGGVLSTLADTAAVYCVLRSLHENDRTTSVEFKINFLAPALVDRGEISATARPVRMGKTIAVIQADLHQGDSCVATGIFTYIIFRDTTR